MSVLMVAIDYTGSNGHPYDPDSLHYRCGGDKPNQYQQAIMSIGQILTPYDSDNKYPVFGFGGSVHGKTSHCFPLTFDPSNIEVTGVPGILQVYDASFNRVSLSGPTHFSDVIATATSLSSKPFTKDLQHYSILLIITDGVINDMQQTIKAVIAAAEKPMSIIIVGVGGADFDKMDQLDSDDGKLSAGGQVAKRDIVQFVPMRKFKPGDMAALAAETLAEIPRQVLEYMKKAGVAPLAPRPPVQQVYVRGGAAEAPAPIVIQPIIMQAPVAAPMAAPMVVPIQPLSPPGYGPGGPPPAGYAAPPSGYVARPGAPPP